jgi:hypothetical protein
MQVEQSEDESKEVSRQKQANDSLRQAQEVMIHARDALANQ